MEVPAKHSRQAAEPRHHAERSVTRTRSEEFQTVVTAIWLSVGNIQAVTWKLDSKPNFDVEHLFGRRSLMYVQAD